MFPWYYSAHYLLYYAPFSYKQMLTLLYHIIVLVTLIALSHEWLTIHLSWCRFSFSFLVPVKPYDACLGCSCEACWVCIDLMPLRRGTDAWIRSLSGSTTSRLLMKGNERYMSTLWSYWLVWLGWHSSFQSKSRWSPRALHGLKTIIFTRTNNGSYPLFSRRASALLWSKMVGFTLWKCGLEYDLKGTVGPANPS